MSKFLKIKIRLSHSSLYLPKSYYSHVYRKKNIKNPKNTDKKIKKLGKHYL
jgi:hypothetical protein